MLSIYCSTNSLDQEKIETSSFSLVSSGIKIDFSIKNQKKLEAISIFPEVYKITTDNLKKVRSTNEVFFHVTGENRSLIEGEPGITLEYIGKKEEPLPNGKRVIISQKDIAKNLLVESFYEFNNVSPVVRRYTKVTNNGNESVGIDYLSSAVINNFNPTGIVDDEFYIHYANNSWAREGQWKRRKPSEMGWDLSEGQFRGNITINNIGSFSTQKYLPIGMIENTKTGLIWFWQIEHNGSWIWKISNYGDGSAFLYLGGPDAVTSNAWKNLKPGESYQTVPVALGVVKGGFNEAVEALTKYRRTVVMRPHKFNTDIPVVYNDYMNTLKANPTTEKEMPLINAASDLGIDYYMIDAGWYSQLGETWWDTVGSWLPSTNRFDGGLEKLIADIKAKGMIPGLWLEIEVVGVNSPLKDKPDNWFFMQHGKRLIDNGRFLLDYRNPEVVAFATGVIDRLINDFGVGYFKLDYNSRAYIGTDADADSPGQGMLTHNRAVVKWYKDMLDNHPGLVLEACASGGNRLDYAMLSQAQISSSSDQENYKEYPAILVGTLAAVIPEQLGVWAYPSVDGDAKEASFGMTTAMMGRLYQSGFLGELSKESHAQVKAGIEIYKSTLAPFIPNAIPFFSLGMPAISDMKTPIAVGLKQNDKAFIAVWRLEGESSVTIPLKETSSIKLLYPQNLGIEANLKQGDLQIIFPNEYMGCIIEVTFLVTLIKKK